MIVSMSLVALLGVAAIAVEFSKATAYRISLQNNLDQAALAVAALCAQQDTSVLNCNDTAALLARSQVFADLNSPETILTSASLAGKTVTLNAKSTQHAPLLRFLESTTSTVTETAKATAGWTSSENQIPLRGTTPPFALDACAWMAYNPTTGSSPGSVQRFNMINDTSDFKRASWTSCTGVPGLSPTAKAAGLNREMLWITWDKGDVNGTDKQNNCELALKPDGVSLAQDSGWSGYASADDGWDDVKDRACVGQILGKMEVGKDMLMPIMAVVPSSASWSSSSRDWSDLQYDPSDAPTFRVLGYAPFRITGFLDRSGNPTLTKCTVTTGPGYDRNPTCTGVAGKFIVKLGEFDDYEYGDGSGTGIVNLGNTGGGATLVK